jgi:hypothetical protein
MNKVKNLFSGVIFGILMLIGGTILLWWNEGNNVRNIKSVDEVSKTVVSISSDKVDKANDGKLVHTNGKLEVVDEQLKDDTFNVEVKTGKLDRVVEMYQWEETSHTDDDDRTTYSYSKVWSSTVIDSHNFHQSGHDNPDTMTISSTTYYADVVKVGAFSLSSEQKTQLNTNATYTMEALPEDSTYKLEAGYVTNAKSLSEAEIGNIRITWKYNDWKEATVLAVQKDDSFVDFTSKEGRKMNRVEEGLKTSEEVIQEIQNEDKMMKWIFRAVGALIIIFGYMAITSPLSKLTSFIPLLGGLVGSAIALFSFLLGLAHSLVIIVIAWFRYRPILAIILLVVIVLCIVGIVKLVKSKKKENPAPVQTA